MRIAIVSPGPFSVPPVNGSSVEHDIDEITRVIGEEHQLTIYARRCPAYPRSTREGNRHYIRFFYQKPLLYLRKVIRDLRKRQADVILVENRPSYVHMLRKAFPKTPILLNMHSHVFASKRMIAPARMKQVGRMINGMLTNSEFLRQHFITKHKIDPAKIHAVHLGVENSIYHAPENKLKGQTLRQKVGLLPEHRVLFYAGRLMQEKGVHLLLKTFREISKRDPLARLVIVGGAGYGSNRQNTYVKRLRRLAAPMKDKVKFVPFIPTKEMPVWYQLADIVATPSLWQEPFCRVNLEAMAAGKPVFSTPRGGVAEVVRNQDVGFLVPPEEWPEMVPRIWQFFWEAPRMRRELGKNAVKRAAELSWEATAAGYLEVCRAVTGEQKAVREKEGDRLRQIS